MSFQCATLHWVRHGRSHITCMQIMCTVVQHGCYYTVKGWVNFTGHKHKSHNYRFFTTEQSILETYYGCLYDLSTIIITYKIQAQAIHTN